MLLSRSVTAACASCVATLVTLPLDSFKVRRQIGLQSRITRPYAGVEWELLSRFASTVVYYHIYETSLSMHHGLLESSATGIAASCLVASPMDIVRRRRQTASNGWRVPPSPLSWITFAKCYGIHLLRNAPRVVLKFLLYEPLYAWLQRSGVDRPVAGVVAALVASVCVSVSLSPIDTLKTHLALGLPFPRPTHLFRGTSFAMAQSVTNNAIGHGLLEWWSPRVG